MNGLKWIAYNLHTQNATVPKKNGENCYVLDYRALNVHSHDDRYTMHTVDECIAEIGKSKSSIFSTMDLSSRYHQMLLN